MSGPLRDRFDLNVEMTPVDPAVLVHEPADAPHGPGDVRRARGRQLERAAQVGGETWNARIPAACLPDGVRPDERAREVLVRGGRNMQLSGRGVHRCLRVARTIADLRGATHVAAADVEFALNLRGDR